MASHGTTRRGRVLTPVAAAICLFGAACLTGWGCGNPPPETAGQPAVSVEPMPAPAPPPEPAADESRPPRPPSSFAPPENGLPPLGVGPVEQHSPSPPGAKRSFGKEAFIRTYLADRFVYANWYPRFREVAVSGDIAAVSAVLPSRSGRKKIASKICTAVLGSKQVRRVRVRDEQEVRVACP